MTSVRDAFDARLDEFETDFCWNSEQDCVLRGFSATGEWVALLFGEPTAVRVMESIRHQLASPEFKGQPSEHDWRSEWLVAEQIEQWPDFFEDLRDLAAFAEFGIYRPWALAGKPGLTEEQRARLAAGGDIAAWVRAVAAKIDTFLRMVGQAEHSGATPFDALVKTRDKALGRLRWDLGEGLSPQDLAALSGVSVKRVQNATYDKSSGGPVLDKQGRIEPDSARDWLLKKKFRFSLWQDIALAEPISEDWGRNIEANPGVLVNDDLADADERAEDFVFVPVASDRTRFLPDARREQGYQIGAKGSETYVQDYYQALEALARQPTPRWRRPNEVGNWGIVSGVAWERLPRAEVDRLLSVA